MLLPSLRELLRAKRLTWAGERRPWRDDDAELAEQVVMHMCEPPTNRVGVPSRQGDHVPPDDSNKEQRTENRYQEFWSALVGKPTPQGVD